MKRGRGTDIALLSASKTFTFFWRPGKEEHGWLSNWSPHSFHDEVYNKLFATAEHYIMYRKALLMKDEAIGHEILKAKSARMAKALGRKVSNWDESLWRTQREEIVHEALRLKVRQNPDIKDLLLGTGDSVIAEASPSDKVWGIGLKSTSRNACVPDKWPGENLLGKMWMKVREEVTEEKRKQQKVDVLADV